MKLVLKFNSEIEIYRKGLGNVQQIQTNTVHKPTQMPDVLTVGRHITQRTSLFS